MTLQQILRSARGARSQQQIAVEVDTSQSAVSCWESEGENHHLPTPAMWPAVAAAYGIPLVTLISAIAESQSQAEASRA